MEEVFGATLAIVKGEQCWRDMLGNKDKQVQWCIWKVGWYNRKEGERLNKNDETGIPT